ncbi:hypothetical protein VTL71DRAFT_14963 [Oculimacula yallundae]|uniref:Uncharacterized protein n=1 Tax=Oculimacula yallundae TaxID=86028 RepID=A0ABR4CH99_9HELO
MRFSIASSAIMAAALANASVLSKRADCQAQADACRTAPDANQSFCSAQLSSCLAYNPYANNTEPATQDPKSACEAAANKCRTAPGANQSTCSAQLAACLGYNPYTEPTPVWVTEVVTKFTTYCPEATTLTYNDHTYVASKGEVLTVTDCPCTITKPAGTAPEATLYPAECSSKGAQCPGYPKATAPVGSAPKPTTPAGNTPSGNTPAGNAPAGDAPTGSTPPGNPPAGNAPAGNAPAGPAGPAEYTGAASLNKPFSSLFALCAAALVIV